MFWNIYSPQPASQPWLSSLWPRNSFHLHVLSPHHTSGGSVEGRWRGRQGHCQLRSTFCTNYLEKVWKFLRVHFLGGRAWTGFSSWLGPGWGSCMVCHLHSLTWRACQSFQKLSWRPMQWQFPVCRLASALPCYSCYWRGAFLRQSLVTSCKRLQEAEGCIHVRKKRLFSKVIEKRLGCHINLQESWERGRD